MVAVGDIYELALTWYDASSTTQSVNVFHFRQKAGFLSAINLVGEFRAGVETELRGIPATSIAIQKYAARSLIPFNADAYEFTLTPTLPGQNGSNMLPMVVAAIITWRTGFPGRRKRGRTYLPGISLNNTQGGRLFATFQNTTIPLFANKVMSLWGAGGSSATTEFGIWSRVNAGPTPPFSPAGFTVGTSFTVQSALGSMGTRRSGRGV